PPPLAVPLAGPAARRSPCGHRRPPGPLPAAPLAVPLAGTAARLSPCGHRRSPFPLRAPPLAVPLAGTPARRSPCGHRRSPFPLRAPPLAVPLAGTAARRSGCGTPVTVPLARTAARRSPCGHPRSPFLLPAGLRAMPQPEPRRSSGQAERPHEEAGAGERVPTPLVFSGEGASCCPFRPGPSETQECLVNHGRWCQGRRATTNRLARVVRQVAQPGRVPPTDVSIGERA